MRARGVAVLVDANLVPGGQSLDVRRKEVLARDGNAHAEDGLHEQAVGARRTGAVDVGDLEGEIVDARSYVDAPSRSSSRCEPIRIRNHQRRTSACPRRPSGSARRTVRSARRCLRPSPSRASSAAGPRRHRAPASRFAAGAVSRVRSSASSPLGVMVRQLHRTHVDAGVALDAQLRVKYVSTSQLRQRSTSWRSARP